MEKQLEDKEIMRQFLEAVKKKPADLAKDLNYKSHNTIYKILQGVGSISTEMVHRITAKYENASPLFLTKGKGEPLVEGKRITNVRNIWPLPENDNPFAPYMEIPARLDEIQEAQAMINTKLDKLLSLLENK